MMTRPTASEFPFSRPGLPPALPSEVPPSEGRPAHAPAEVGGGRFRRGLALGACVLASVLATSELAGAAAGAVGTDRLVLPEGLEAAEWAAIRGAHEAARYAVEPAEAGYQARNPGQRWWTRFDGRGSTIRADGAAWTWGLELVRYGFRGQELAVTQPQSVAAEGARMLYQWSDLLEEWYVNDRRGLEHGFTVLRRPVADMDGAERGPLTFTLVVRGGLSPEVYRDGRGARFRDVAGAEVLTYSGLTVFDADGETLPAWIEVVAEGLRLHVQEAGARYPLTIDPLAQQAYLKASNTDTGDDFGRSIAISGDTVAVGAPWEQSSAAGVNGSQANNGTGYGAVYVFVRNGSTWSQQAYVKASNPNGNDRFGASVALSGDTLVVGATGEASSSAGVNGNQMNNTLHGSGAVYVFVRNGTNWSQQAYLKASNPGGDDEFGGSVAISGDTVVVGAALEDSDATGVGGDQGNDNAPDSGAAYVFVRIGTSWSQQAYLKASNTDPDDRFGSVVALSADRAIVGAPREASGSTGVNAFQGDNSVTRAGAAYVFVRSGTSWSQEAYLKASNTGQVDYFGSSVCISADTAAVGAPYEDSSSTGVNGNPFNDAEAQSGAAYLFERTGFGWGQAAYVKASNTGSQDYFGTSLALDGDTLLVGAPGEASNTTGVNGNQGSNATPYAGAAYQFVRTGSTWAQGAYIKASNADGGDRFGSAVGLSGTTLVVGAPEEDSVATGVNGNQGFEGALDSGAAYVFDDVTPGCDPYVAYCTQTTPTSVPGCFAKLSVCDTHLGGTWDVTDIPGGLVQTVGLFLYTHSPTQGQSTYSLGLPIGTLCLQGFKRSTPACMLLAISTQIGACNTATSSLSPGCNGGALGIAPGDGLNVQFWYRDTSAGGSRFSNAIYYDVMP